MRFGKRGKNPLSWGWRAAGAQEEQPQDLDIPRNSEPPELPLPPEPTAAPSAPPEVSRTAKEGRVVASDPTQRLLTSLGRFQRQFMKARDGAPQAQWSDECMSHLIQGVEIALEQEWGDLVEALTETGRVLQTYEDAGRANQCVPFLADSYEILCLMVGDLIVDKVRTGVMRKWRDRYQAVLEDLAADGLTLLSDEEDRGGIAGASRYASAAGSQEVPEPSADDSPFDAEPGSSLGTELLGELPPLRMSDLQGPPAQAEAPYFEPSEAEAHEDFAESSSAVAGELAPWEMETPGGHEVTVDTGRTTEESYVSESPFDGQEYPLGASQAQVEPGLSRDLAEILDALCDGLAQLENDPEGSPGTVFLYMDDSLHTLHDRAQSLGWGGAASACDAMARLCSAASGRQGRLGDRFFEVAYAFGGVYGEVRDREDDSQLNSWISELNQLLDQWSNDESSATSQASGHDESPFELPEHQGSAFEDVLGEVPSFDDVALGPVARELPPDLASEIPSDLGEDTHTDVPLEVSSSGAVDSYGSDAAADPASASAPEMSLGEGESGEPADLHPQPEEAPAQEKSEPVAEPKFVEISSAEPERVAPAPLEDPASQLLDTARQAVASGSSSDAKMLAMQAAASIARAQAKEAEARVRQAEVRLQETAKSIELARKQVQEAEVQVTDAEIRVDDGKEALAERGRHTHGVMGSLDGIRARISDLDRRIQELQAQREEAVRQQAAAETALDEARQQESQVRAHLDTLKNSEQMARVRLEDSRGQIKLLQRKQAEIEAIMERARESLTRHRDSMADIEKTIEVIRSAETGDGLDGSELLF